MNIPPSVEGFLRGIGTVILFAVLSYLANSANLTGIVNVSVAGIISGIALAIEGSMKSQGSGGLFGMVKR